MSMISAIASKLSNFTTTHVRLEPNQGRQSIGPGGSIEFDLPSESVINLDSFALSFRALAINNNPTRIASLPAGIEELIEDISVWCGGVRLDSGTGWHGLRSTLMNRNLDLVGSATSHPYIQRQDDRAAGTLLVDGSSVEPESRYTTQNMGGSGFLRCGVIDTSLMPQLTVRVLFTTRHVVSASLDRDTIYAFTNLGGDETANSYQISDQYAMVEVMSPGSMYDRIQSRIMDEVGYISIPFKYYRVFVGGRGESTSRFDAHTRSLDRVYVASLNAISVVSHPYLPNRFPLVSTDVNHSN